MKVRATVLCAIAFGTTAIAQPTITSVVNAASYQPGIESGSWVAIMGSNLAGTTQQWTQADFNGSMAPTSIGGVSVTIDGIPAFIYFISPTQINVAAPSDNNIGTVNVVVNNNGNISPPAPAQLQTFAPAFFMDLPSNFALITRLPDYAVIADPSVVPGTVAAAPGDYVVAWGTGFGPTYPPLQGGLVVSGVPPQEAAGYPAITVGGVPAVSFLTFLSPGSIGLYSIVFQIPLNAPAGAVPIQASVGGYQTQTAMVFIAGQ